MQTAVIVNGYTFFVEPTAHPGANSPQRLEKWTKPCEVAGCRGVHRFLTREGSAPLFANPRFGVLFCARHRPRASLRSVVHPKDRLAILADKAAGADLPALVVAYPYPAHIISAVLREKQGSVCVKLSPALAAEIRERHAAGESCCALARVYGVHRNSIHRILNGATWA